MAVLNENILFDILNLDTANIKTVTKYTLDVAFSSILFVTSYISQQIF